jgi:DNA mismatch repair protein MutS
MTFTSVLFLHPADRSGQEPAAPPACYHDLNLDQIVDAITAGKPDYDLPPFFFTPLPDTDSIRYRHEVFRDLQNERVYRHVQTFAADLREMRAHLTQAGKLYYQYEKEAWFLDAVAIYCEAVLALADALAAVPLQSRGLLALRDYLSRYANSDRFTTIQQNIAEIRAALSEIGYCLKIKDSSIQVRQCESELEYSSEITAVFAKFEGGPGNPSKERPSSAYMNHVEAGVLSLVAKLYPDAFAQLHRFCEENSDYLDPLIGQFDREVQFYITYLNYMAPLTKAGLAFCYPLVSRDSKRVRGDAVFDLALATKLVGQQKPVVCNDFRLQGQERIIVVTGPNQGGKTTFARTFGQLHQLACLGCPVPGTEARLFLFDQLFTHFEREEALESLRGKLQDDLLRIHEILAGATSNSIIIMNEIFTSTTLHDAVFLSTKVLEKLIALDALCVWVTFIDELAAFAEQTVSMVSSVVAEDPMVRTYRIERRPADGMAYALAIAEKHHLTYRRLRERLAR